MHGGIMAIEDLLKGWTGPSSASEKDKQDRAERMVRDAAQAHAAFNDCDLTIFAKGSYANNTNVRSDSDVDIAVECSECIYWEEARDGAHPAGQPYRGEWTPYKLRTELARALQAKFPGQVDTSGSIALRVNASSARVDADVVPCFTYKYYFSPTSFRQGTRVFRANETWLENYPRQQLENGTAKNNRTNRSFKRAVRILKRVENALVDEGLHKPLPSYFIECLAYNCPDATLLLPTWTETIRGVLVHVFNELEGDEPSVGSSRWLETNECKYLFYTSQPWKRADGRSFAKAAWNYLGYDS